MDMDNSVVIAGGGRWVEVAVGTGGINSGGKKEIKSIDSEGNKSTRGDVRVGCLSVHVRVYQLAIDTILLQNDQPQN